MTQTISLSRSSTLVMLSPDLDPQTVPAETLLFQDKASEKLRNLFAGLMELNMTQCHLIGRKFAVLCPLPLMAKISSET